MVQEIKYKKPRRINPVSVTLVALLLLFGYLAYQFVPLFLIKQESYRVLEEHGSKYAGKRSFYRADPKRMEDLQRKMNAELRRVGVSDPEMESWIEIDGREVRFGCIFSVYLHWPFGVIEDQEFVFEPEHLVVDPR
jgi:hypothetical protein